MDSFKLPPFFYEIFDASLTRLGPGDNAMTKKALDILLAVRKARLGDRTSAPLSVIDIGCGNGPQTIELARHIEGTIFAFDNYQPFLDELNRRAEKAGVAEKIRTGIQDMFTLEKIGVTYDIIWAEGSIFIVGFREGLMKCRHLVRPGSLIAMSEMAWFRPDPPQECVEFMKTENPAILDVATNLAIIEECGYTLIDHFPLPETAWSENFYRALEARVRLLRTDNEADPDKKFWLDTVQHEIDIYRKYSRYYGYEFFLMEAR